MYTSVGPENICPKKLSVTIREISLNFLTFPYPHSPVRPIPAWKRFFSISEFYYSISVSYDYGYRNQKRDQISGQSNWLFKVSSS